MIDLSQTSINSLTIGNSPVKGVWLGDEKIWPNSTGSLQFKRVVYGAPLYGKLHPNADSFSGFCYFICDYIVQAGSQSTVYAVSATPIAFDEFVVSGKELSYDKRPASQGGYGNVGTNSGNKTVTLTYCGLTTTGQFNFAGNYPTYSYLTTGITLTRGTYSNPIPASGATVSYNGGNYSRNTTWTSGVIEQNTESGNVAFVNGGTNSSGYTAYMDNYSKKIYVSSLENTPMGVDYYHFVSTSPVTTMTVDVYQDSNNVETTIGPMYDAYDNTTGQKFVEYNVDEYQGGFVFYIGRTRKQIWKSGYEFSESGTPVSNSGVTITIQSGVGQNFITGVSPTPGGEVYSLYYERNTTSQNRSESVIINNIEGSGSAYFTVKQSASTATYTYELQNKETKYYGGSATSSTGIHPTSGIEYCEFVCYYIKKLNGSEVERTTVTATPVCTPYFVASGTKLYYNYDEYKGNVVNGRNYTATLNYGNAPSKTATFKFAGNSYNVVDYLITGVSITGGAGSSASNPIAASGDTNISYTGGEYKAVKRWSSGYESTDNSVKIPLSAAYHSLNNTITGLCIPSSNVIQISNLSTTAVSAGYYDFTATTPQYSFKVYQAANSTAVTNVYELYKTSPNPVEKLTGYGSSVFNFTASTNGGSYVFDLKKNTKTTYASGAEYDSTSSVSLAGGTVTVYNGTGGLFVSASIVNEVLSVNCDSFSGPSTTKTNVVAVSYSDGGFTLNVYQAR